MELVIVALATFTILMFVLGLLPFQVPAKLMPLATSALAWGCVELYAKLPALVESAGVAGGVAIVTRYAVSRLPEPVSLDDLLGRVIEMVPRRVLEAPWSRPKAGLRKPVRPKNLPDRIPRL